MKYDIRVEYREQKGMASVKLLWSSASTPKAIVPQKQLYLPPVIIIRGHPIKPHYDDEDDDDDSEDGEKDNITHLPGKVNAGLYPNPVHIGQNTTLQISSSNGGTAVVQVLSITGTVVLSEQVPVGAGVNTKTIHTSGLRPGLYIVRITGSVNQLSSFMLLVI